VIVRIQPYFVCIQPYFVCISSVFSCILCVFRCALYLAVYLVYFDAYLATSILKPKYAKNSTIVFRPYFGRILAVFCVDVEISVFYAYSVYCTPYRKSVFFVSPYLTVSYLNQWDTTYFSRIASYLSRIFYGPPYLAVSDCIFCIVVYPSRISLYRDNTVRYGQDTTKIHHDTEAAEKKKRICREK
jgi:hypothetical protein